MFFLAALAVIGTSVAAGVESDKQTKEGIKNQKDATYMSAVTKQINAYATYPGAVPTGH